MSLARRVLSDIFLKAAAAAGDARRVDSCANSRRRQINTANRVRYHDDDGVLIIIVTRVRTRVVSYEFVYSFDFVFAVNRRRARVIIVSDETRRPAPFQVVR